MNDGQLDDNTLHTNDHAVLNGTKSTNGIINNNCNDNENLNQMTSVSHNAPITSAENNHSATERALMMMNLVMTGTSGEDRQENFESKRMTEESEKTFHNNNGNSHSNAFKSARLSPNSLDGKSNANVPFGAQAVQMNGAFPFGMDIQQQQQFLHSLKNASLASPPAEDSSNSNQTANANAAAQAAAQVLFAQMLNAAAVSSPALNPAVQSLIGNSALAGIQPGADMNNPWNNLFSQIMTAGQQQQQQHQLLLQAGLAQQLQQNVSHCRHFTSFLLSLTSIHRFQALPIL